MLVRLSKNSFVRMYEGKGYIINQLTRYDRLYNETGADFLSCISRECQSVDEIINDLSNIYGDSVSPEKLSNDFLNFINSLEKCFFVVTGDTVDECTKKDMSFSYSLGDIKTKIKDFTQPTDQQVDRTTNDYMLKCDQRKAHLKSMQIETTSRCNERCIHCYIPNGKKNLGKDMKIDLFRNIVDQFVNLGGFHLSLSGGEVFLHKEIISMIQFCREKDLEICILSNLVSLEDWQIPYIKEANVSYIQTSLYSMDSSVHDAITTVKGSQVKTKTALEKLIAADIPVQISCPLMKANKDSYVGVLQYARSLGVKSFSDYILMGRADLCTDNLAHRLSIDETEKVIREIIENDRDYDKWIREKRQIVETIDTAEYSRQAICGVGLNNICIAENGDVYPCPGWQSMIVGNVYKSSLRDIWEKSNELKLLRRITHADFPKCLNCAAKKYCAMCLERNSNENNGNMYKVGKHFCDVAFLMKKLHEEYKQKGVLL